jgi:hypothetical protein
MYGFFCILEKLLWVHARKLGHLLLRQELAQIVNLDIQILDHFFNLEK